MEMWGLGEVIGVEVGDGSGRQVGELRRNEEKIVGKWDQIRVGVWGK